MDVVTNVATVGTLLDLTASLISLLRDVKEATKERIQFVDEANNLYRLLIDLKKHIAANHGAETLSYALRALNIKNGQLEQLYDGLEELQNLLLVKSGGLGQFRFSMKWKFTREEAARVLKKMEQLKSQIVIALNLDQFLLLQGTKQDISAIRRDNDAIKNDTVAIRASTANLQADSDIRNQERQHERHCKIAKWLSPEANFLTEQQYFLSKRQPGTAEWFLASNQFTTWVSQARQTLFCPGIPGAGKTVTSAVATEYLKEKYPDESSQVAVVCLFCKHKPQIEQSTKYFVTAILRQLLQDLPKVPKDIDRLYDKCLKRETPPQLKESLCSLCNILGLYDTVFLIVDGLDEFSDERRERTQFLDELDRLQQRYDLRIMFTSRFTTGMETTFERSIKLEIRARDEDVRAFVDSRILQFRSFFQKDEELKSQILSKIVGSANGMFLLASLWMESIRNQHTKAMIQDALYEMFDLSKASASSKELYGKAYNEVMKRIRDKPPEIADLAMRTLKWITFAKRPLATDELRHALAINLNKTAFNVNNVTEMADILVACAGLVTLGGGNDSVQLVHYTTQEYLEQTQSEWSPSTQRDLTSSCLYYLSQAEFQSGRSITSNDLKRRVEKHPLLLYAADFWGSHAKTAQDDLFEAITTFIMDENLFTTAAQAMWIGQTQLGRHINNLKKLSSSHSTPVHMVANFGLSSVLARLMTASTKNITHMLDSRDFDLRTPLIIAAQNADETIVEMLLRSGKVDPDAAKYDGMTALSIAASDGFNAIVEMLLNTGKVTLDRKDFCGYTPLMLAADNGHLTLVQMLLNTGRVNPDRQDLDGNSSLTLAAMRGETKVLQVLLDTGMADPDLRDQNDRTPLIWAALKGHAAVVQMLMETGQVALDAMDENLRTPLFYASMGSHERVVELLLASGKVDPEQADGSGETPLSWAKTNGFEASFMKNFVLGKMSAPKDL